MNKLFSKLVEQWLSWDSYKVFFLLNLYNLSENSSLSFTNCSCKECPASSLVMFFHGGLSIDRCGKKSFSNTKSFSLRKRESTVPGSAT